MPDTFDITEDPPLPKRVSGLRCASTGSALFCLSEFTPREPRLHEYFIENGGKGVVYYDTNAHLGTKHGKRRWIVKPRGPVTSIPPALTAYLLPTNVLQVVKKTLLTASPSNWSLIYVLVCDCYEIKKPLHMS